MGIRLGELYSKAIEVGLENDPRSREEIDELLKRERRRFEGLSDKEKEFFDRQLLEHPFADSRILNGNPDSELNRVMVGIDIDTAELLLADRLSASGRKIDAVISHHPSARAWAQFYEVMDMQVDILQQLGVNPVLAEKLLQERKEAVRRKVMPANHHKALDCAKLLGISWVCMHTPSDNCVYSYLKRYFEENHYRTVGDVIDLLYEIPEYQEGARRGTPPVILLGSRSSLAGRIALEMTGGTEPSVENYRHLVNAGIGTIVGMHFSEEHYKKAKEAKLNLVVAGHMSSDTLGMNLLLDEVMRRLGQRLEVIAVSGFYRVER